jgi:hypothetical protein
MYKVFLTYTAACCISISVINYRVPWEIYTGKNPLALAFHASIIYRVLFAIVSTV